MKKTYLFIFSLLSILSSLDAQNLWGVGTLVGTAHAEFQSPFIQTGFPGSYSVNGWTTLSIYDNGGGVTPGSAYWIRTLTGHSQGGYAGTTPITSPSQSNGVAIFDSDYMDNNGVPGAFNTGSSPSNHKGELISPRIDLTGNTNELISVKFYSRYRDFQTTELSISFSSDDGVTWGSSIDYRTLQGSNVDGFITVDLPASTTLGVINLSQCRIKYTFDGDYYYAMIDDITILRTNPPTWTGSTDTDWHTGSNWSTGAVPTSSDDVIIPDVSGTSNNFPIITAATTLGNITVDAGVNLSVSTGIVLDGTFTNNGTVTLKNGAYLDDFTNAGATYIGDITAEQLVTSGSGLGQRLVGSPVVNGVIQGLDGTYASGNYGQLLNSACSSTQLDAGSPYSNILEWHENAVSPSNCSHEAWYAINASSLLDNGRAYSCWVQDGNTISFTGVPNTGNINYGGLSNSGAGLADKDGWHFLSNPYPSALDASTLTSNGWSNLQTYNASSGAYGGTFQPILPAQNLAVMQGFVAKSADLNLDISSISSNSISGNHDYPFNLGNDFDVTTLAGVTISKLGAFDSNGDGIVGNINVAVYSRTTGSIILGLTASISGMSDPLVGGYRMKSITPFLLPQGQYSVVAIGFNGIDQNGNNVIGGYPNPTSNPINGISYGNSRYGNGLGSFPTFLQGGFYDAGSIGVLSVVPAPTSASFTNDMRVANNPTFLSTSDWFTSKLDIEVSGNGLSDISYLYFNETATANFDNQWDCEKRNSDFGKPTLFTKINSTQISLNGNNSNELGNQDFPLGLKSGTNGIFTFSFGGMETFPANTTIYVKDLQGNVVHNIANGDYSFTANTADNADRFEIIFVPEVSLKTTKVDCEGNAGTLQVSNTNFIANRTFEIIANDVVISTNDLVNLNESLEAGTYTVNVNDQYGGTQVYTIEIENAELIEAAFTVSSNELFVGEMLQLSNSTVNSTTVNWSIDHSTITDVNNATYSFSEAGVYDVVLSVSNDECTDTKTETITVVNKTTGIETVDGETINFYPNPATSVLYINSAKDINIEIVDVLGQIVIKTIDKTINLENITTGMYIIQIYDMSNKLIGTEKMIKK